MYYLAFWFSCNAAYLAFSALRANVRITQDYLRSPRDKHFDEVIKCVIENNKRFADGESWTFDKSGKIQHHQVLEFKKAGE